MKCVANFITRTTHTNYGCFFNGFNLKFISGLTNIIKNQ